jgi:small nuclear ribonucleoprotein (snRNP)-like protein
MNDRASVVTHVLRGPKLPTLGVLAQSLQGALVHVTTTSGSSFRGTLDQCTEHLQMVLVNAEQTSDAGHVTMHEQVQLASDDVVGVEFAHAIDVHRLMRTKEKGAERQKLNRTKRAPGTEQRPEPSVLVVEGVHSNRSHVRSSDVDASSS